MTEIITKLCKECGVEKPCAQFYKHKAMADGYLNKCKECVKSRVKNHRVDNLEDHKERDRIRDSKRWEYKTEQTAKYRARNPEKYKARTAVGNALRDGRLEKQPCRDCGSITVEAHHDDYSRPLDVIWLCKSCHFALHKENLK